MFPTQPEDYISVIASNFLFPITSILETLEEDKYKGPNEVQCSPRENGYSIGIIILAVLMVESAIGRIQYLIGKRPPEKPLEFIKDLFPVSDYYSKLEEIFVIRDVIAHNHIWKADIYWDENMSMRLVSAKLIEGYGDQKYKRVVNKEKRLTRILGLNIFPNRICRSDAIIVLLHIVGFLSALENTDRNYFVMSHQWVKYRDNVVNFCKLISELKT